MLKGLFHPLFLARVISWFAFVCRLMGNENGDNKGKRGKPIDGTCKGMMEETDPLMVCMGMRIPCLIVDTFEVWPFLAVHRLIISGSKR